MKPSGTKPFLTLSNITFLIINLIVILSLKEDSFYFNENLLLLLFFNRPPDAITELPSIINLYYGCTENEGHG
jgi:hypothetical protein